ncbi:MAG: hypothetical protein ACKOCV_06005, partial [Gemmatimonadota bacterium]
VADGVADGRADTGPDRGFVSVTAERITTLGVTAIFTTTALADQVAAGTPMVLFDDVPARAIFIASDGRRIDIDLGSHFGLTIEGSTDEPGREEECLVIADTDVSLSHHEVLSGDDRIPADLTTLLAPLLRGAHLQTVITP